MQNAYIHDWLKTNFLEFTSKSDLVKACANENQVAKTYVYRILKTDEELTTICEFWNILDEIEDNLIDEKAVIKKLKVGKDSWVKLRAKYDLDMYRISITKGKTRGIYFGCADVIEDLEQFIKDTI